MDYVKRPTPQRLFIGISLLTALLASLLAFEVLGPVVGIKSGYVFFGIVLAAGIYYGTDTLSPHSLFSGVQQRSPRLWPKLVLTVIALSIAVVAGARDTALLAPSTARVGVLLLALPIGYALLVVEIHQQVSPKWLLVQVLGLFALSPVTKYLATDFYFGKGDSPKHVYYVDLITSNGTWLAIPEESFYHYFPGLQTLLGSASMLTGLSAYDSFILIGILTYVFTLCTVYLIARWISGDTTIAIFVALAASILAPIHVHSTYFFPQAFAFASVLILLFITIRSSVVGNEYGLHALLAAPIVVSLWFTHHLTVVLFVPIILVLVTVPVLATRLFGVEEVVRPHVIPLFVWVVGSFFYWVLEGLFIEPLIWSIRSVVSGAGVVSQSASGTSIQAVGLTIPEPSVSEAILSLFSSGGIYNIGLVCVLALGVVMLLSKPAEYKRPMAFILVGLLGSVILLRTPIAAVGIKRFQLPLSVFVAFVVGIGLTRLFSVTSTSTRKFVPAVLVFVLLATASPVVAADDLYGLHAGPDLWESRTLPEQQKEFTDVEMRSLEQSARFIEQRDVTVGTDWHSDIGLGRYGVEATGFTSEDDHIETSGDLLLYRQRWPDHSLRLIPEKFSLVTFLVSEDWMRDFVQTENKVYTTGEVGMVADREDGEALQTR